MIEKAFVMLWNEVCWWIKDKCAFGGSFFGIFTEYLFPIFDLLIVIIPVLDGANGRLTLEYFIGEQIIFFINLYLCFFLFNSEMTFWYECMIIARVSMLLNLGLLLTQNICKSID